MYSRSQLAKKYIAYLTKAMNGKGHGMHSPFVYDFIIHVLNDRKTYDCYDKIEPIRKALLQNNETIEVEDFGAGSTLTPYKKRKIKDIAASSLKRKKYARLLFRIAKYYHCETIVELGTSLGITTSYLAFANNRNPIFTLEGAQNVAAIAQRTFAQNDLKNIHLILGNFDHTLPNLLPKIASVDLLFIDGNHRKVPTLNYFKDFLSKVRDHSIFIFDDIHWSTEMEEAWEEVKQHEAVTLSIDLFFIGLVFFSKNFKVKQHFTIRF